jgi:hypothetical protein
MATGIKDASLALAVLPFLVNQLEAYVRGIEKIKLLRHYQSQFAQYSAKLRAQHVILLDTLEQVLSLARFEDSTPPAMNDYPIKLFAYISSIYSLYDLYLVCLCLLV